ncbi:hypothetical protein CASFOL_014612 [Castilleja foliolosa]|uniref:Uncharacterized protein n=1 Tax=Castilleja foliolosa TaxID=1961234 RepID=A0ABD3DNZ6_9LAMI
MAVVQSGRSPEIHSGPSDLGNNEPFFASYVVFTFSAGRRWRSDGLRMPRRRSKAVKGLRSAVSLVAAVVASGKQFGVVALRW